MLIIKGYRLNIFGDKASFLLHQTHPMDILRTFKPQDLITREATNIVGKMTPPNTMDQAKPGHLCCNPRTVHEATKGPHTQTLQKIYPGN